MSEQLQGHGIDEAGSAGQALMPRHVGHRLLVFAAAFAAGLVLAAATIGDEAPQWISETGAEINEAMVDTAESIQKSGQGINTAASDEDGAFADEGEDDGPYTQQEGPYLADASGYHGP